MIVALFDARQARRGPVAGGRGLVPAWVRSRAARRVAPAVGGTAPVLEPVRRGRFAGWLLLLPGRRPVPGQSRADGHFERVPVQEDEIAGELRRQLDDARFSRDRYRMLYGSAAAERDVLSVERKRLIAQARGLQARLAVCRCGPADSVARSAVLPEVWTGPDGVEWDLTAAWRDRFGALWTATARRDGVPYLHCHDGDGPLPWVVETFGPLTVDTGGGAAREA